MIVIKDAKYLYIKCCACAAREPNGSCEKVKIVKNDGLSVWTTYPDVLGEFLLNHRFCSPNELVLEFEE